MKIEIISAPNAPRSVGPYSQATRAEEFIFCSGQGGFERQRGNTLRVAFGSKRVRFLVTWKLFYRRREVASVAW